MINATTSAATIVEPTGVPTRIEISMPSSAQITEKIAEKIVTLLKLLKIRMAESAGKITSAEIRSDPTRFMARTMITAMMTDKRRLYLSTFVPAEIAKFSSNVIAKILL